MLLLHISILFITRGRNTAIVAKMRLKVATNAETDIIRFAKSWFLFFIQLANN